MQSYYRRLLMLARRDPRKIPSLLRLKLSKREGWTPDVSRPGSRVPPPLVIAVRPSYNCNLRCVMCNQWGENGAFVETPGRLVKREMSTADFKAFFDDVSAFKPYIYFTGGEPLMNKDIIELVAYASSKHLVTSMSTNSTFLEEKAEDLIRAGLDYLYTSLDTPSASTAGIVRINAKGADSHNQAAAAIRSFIELRDRLGVGLPIVQTQTIIVEENQHRLSEMAEFVESRLRPDVWGLQLCVYTTPDLNQATTDLYMRRFGQDQVGWTGFVRDFPGIDPAAIERQLGEIARRKWSFKLRPYRPLGMKGFDVETYFTRPEEDATAERLSCMNPYVFAQIQPNGDVAFCGSQPDYTIGNVKESGFLDLWNNERSREWRTFLNERHFPSCKRCFSLHEFAHFRK